MTDVNDRQFSNRPDNIDPNQIEAVYDKGVLCLTCPTGDKAKPNKIKIKG